MASKFVMGTLHVLHRSLASFSLNFRKKFLNTFIKAIYDCADWASPAAKNVSQQNNQNDDNEDGNDHWNETKWRNPAA